MKQLLVLSGKGGTGKTTLSTAFIRLSGTDVYSDCDVDAPNLHLLNSVDTSPGLSDFKGMEKATIDRDCIGCLQCINNCRFDAIDLVGGKALVNPYACEGCGVCKAVCPAGAVSMVDDVAGQLMLYDEKDYFSTAKLNMGSGTSGKLVSAVKNQLKGYEGNSELTIIDGSPGIGCPVIASVSGVDMVLVVAEPTLSGKSDMERILATARHFNTKAMVCVNKSDVNPELSEAIEHQCEASDIPFVGCIPYDRQVPKLLNEGKSILDEDCAAGREAIKIYRRMMAYI